MAAEISAASSKSPAAPPSTRSTALGPRLGDWFERPRDDDERRDATLNAQGWLIDVLKGRKFGEFAEHSRLGDFIQLATGNKDANGGYEKVGALARAFKLPNGLELTYGSINGLAGDFYGTDKPISDGKDMSGPDGRVERFKSAFYWLAEDKTRAPTEAPSLLNALADEVQKFKEAIAKHQDPAYAYAKQMKGMTCTFEEITWGRKSIPGYIGISRINLDHFGDDAVKAYTAGHFAAMEVAKLGGKDNLSLAYAMNAFADHYLEDMFSAGHMRTPRRLLHGTGVESGLDYCAKFMHDEDCAIGLNVTNSVSVIDGHPVPSAWRAFGDKRYASPEDTTNWRQCLNAVQKSADEIFEVWKSGTILPESSWNVWQSKPVVINDPSHQELAPLFHADGGRRKSIENRRDWETWPWSGWSEWNQVGTLAQLEISDWWTYKMTMDGGGGMVA